MSQEGRLNVIAEKYLAEFVLGRFITCAPIYTQVTYTTKFLTELCNSPAILLDSTVGRSPLEFMVM